MEHRRLNNFNACLICMACVPIHVTKHVPFNVYLLMGICHFIALGPMGALNSSFKLDHLSIVLRVVPGRYLHMPALALHAVLGHWHVLLRGQRVLGRRLDVTVTVLLRVEPLRASELHRRRP